MDGLRFDGMAKKLAARASRRGVLGGVLAAGAGALAARAVGAQDGGPPADPGATGCEAACGVEFKREGQAAKRQGCIRACAAAAADGATCAAACRAEFPAREQRGARRRCVSACVQATEGAA